MPVKQSSGNVKEVVYEHREVVCARIIMRDISTENCLWNPPSEDLERNRGPEQCFKD